MSKKFEFNRYYLKSESLSYQESLERREKEIPLQQRIVLRMNTDDFLESLFGVEDFYLIPNVTSDYQKNMVEQITVQCLYLLNQAVDELDRNLYTWMNYFLQSVNYLLESKGWKENKSLKEEVDTFNKRLDMMPALEDSFHVANPSFIHRNFLFYVDAEKNEVTTSYGNIQKDFEGTAPIILHVDRGFSSIEKLECGINLLTEFLYSLKKEYAYIQTFQYNWGQTKCGAHEEFLVTLKRLANCIAYLVHTTSWRENKLLPFDEYEIRRKAHTPINDAFCRFFENDLKKEESR